MARYVNFVTWREDAVERGAKVRKVAVTNFNTLARRQGRCGHRLLQYLRGQEGPQAN